ncbi:Uncharacterized protein APZ42_025476 [Daphnia magna]|uniref:Uncharacterized protein n=1 Tax=Daphnia magna TaxID=35525 RepID=A0A164T239_9CRUS|nr:Uncharacterized protein APZ42_025476 [Daphnia magna]
MAGRTARQWNGSSGGKRRSGRPAANSRQTARQNNGKLNNTTGMNGPKRENRWKNCVYYLGLLQPLLYHLHKTALTKK